MKSTNQPRLRQTQESISPKVRHVINRVQTVLPHWPRRIPDKAHYWLTEFVGLYVCVWLGLLSAVHKHPPPWPYLDKHYLTHTHTEVVHTCICAHTHVNPQAQTYTQTENLAKNVPTCFSLTSPLNYSLSVFSLHSHSLAPFLPHRRFPRWREKWHKLKPFHTFLSSDQPTPAMAALLSPKTASPISSPINQTTTFNQSSKRQIQKNYNVSDFKRTFCFD